MNSVKKTRARESLDEKPSLHSRQPRRRPLADIKVDENTIVLSPREMVRKEFASRLQRVLRQKNWKQIDLARAAKIGRDSVNSYIRGRMLPSADKLEKIAKALRMEVQELMPSHVETLAERDNPPLEIRQSSDGSGKVWIKVNQQVTLDQASKIFDVLKAG